MDDFEKSLEAEDEPPILPGDVPVEMPRLPARMDVTTAEQFKAMSDPLRRRILGVVTHEPATAKQLAGRLGATPGTVGHHLKVLEEAGLVKLVARRLVRGIVAKYYTRSARLFTYDLPEETVPEGVVSLDMLNAAREELAEAIMSEKPGDCQYVAFPHARLTRQQAEQFRERIVELINDFVAAAPGPDTESYIYGFSLALFQAPPYLQGRPTSTEDESDGPAE